MNSMRSFNRTIKYLLVFLVCSLLLSGCKTGMKPSVENALSAFFVREEKQETTVEVKTGEDIIVVEKVEEIDLIEENTTAELSGTDFAKAQEEIIANGNMYYAYSQLNEDEQLVYTQILGILDSFSTDVKVSSLDTDIIDKAFNCVLIDHPELFYISGYSYTKFVRGEKLEKITVSGTYTMSESEARKALDRVESYSDECIAGYTKGGDDYQKVKYVFEYLIKNNEYDLTAPNNQNVLSVVDEHRTVCQGYAKMTQYILNKMGVFCTLCEGVVKGSEPHVWNVVRVNGDYYHVDTTWGDASYNLIQDSETPLDVPDINYDYLCLTDDMIKETHVINSTTDLPECNSMNANYYVEEGLYFTELNTDQVKEVFENALLYGEKSVTIKCASPNVYAAMYAHLIEDQNVFNYLNGSTNINYVEFKDECRISFYL